MNFSFVHNIFKVMFLNSFKLVFALKSLPLYQTTKFKTQPNEAFDKFEGTQKISVVGRVGNMAGKG